MLARLVIPPQCRRDAPCEITLAILHPMELGIRRKDDGSVEPRNIIESVRISVDGELVLSITNAAGIAANPSFTFTLTPQKTGELRADWVDTRGTAGTISGKLNVAA